MTEPEHPVDELLRRASQPHSPTEEGRRLARARLDAAIAIEGVRASEGRAPSEDPWHILDDAELDSSHPHRHNRRSRALIALGAAATVLALGLPLLLVLNGDESTLEQPIEPTGPTIPGASPTPNSPPANTTLPTVELEWAASELPGIGPVVAAIGTGLRAVTSEGVWASPDGVAWQQIAELESNMAIDQLVASGTILIARGVSVTEDESGARTGRSALWVSLDVGESWDAVDLSGAVQDVSDTPLGLVAVGFVTDDNDSSVIRQGAIWVSQDGVEWELTALSSDPEGTSSKMNAVTWDSGLVVLGEKGPHVPSEASGTDQPATWEPVTWRYLGEAILSVEPVSSDLVGTVEDVSVTPYGILALTYWSTPAQKDNSGVWISRDGLAWQPLTIGGGQWQYSSITTDGAEAYITGYSLGSGLSVSEIENRIWHSRDGETWTSVETPEVDTGVRVRFILTAAGSVLVAGDVDSGETVIGIAKTPASG
ncbi:MAG: hypothetical protein WD269_00550 [Acidimicrobiia bacterium]